MITFFLRRALSAALLALMLLPFVHGAPARADVPSLVSGKVHRKSRQSPRRLSLPAPWKSADIGKVGVAGAAHSANGTFTITGAGEDIFGAADSFHFVWQPWHGDGQITARVVRYQRRDQWTKVGVMARETTGAGAKFADVLVTPDRGAEFQSRAQDGGDTQTSDQVPSPAPFWVRLVRAGDTLTGYVSPDGQTWTQRGQSAIPMAQDILLGLCVTSHKNDATTEAVVDSVTVK